MKRLLCVCLVWAVAAAFALATPVQAGSQPAAQLILLDKNNRPITTLVDGNQISLKVDLDKTLDADSKVDFLLLGVEAPVATCTVRAGGSDCQSDSFPALGWYWNTDGSAQPRREIRARVNGTQVDGNLTVSVEPRPVVMVHGFNSNYEAWRKYLGPQGYLASMRLQGYAVGDGQVPGVMNTGSLSNPNARTNTIAQNAAILGEYIDHVQAKTKAEKVDLLVHSMGGIIARYYLDRVMADSDVAQLINLGAPMGGSDCATLPAALGVLLPTMLELQPSYMTGVFNQQIYKRHGVPFHAIAGTKLSDAVESPCTPVPSDLVVTVDSAKAIPMPVQGIPLLHNDLKTSIEVFTDFVKPLLQTPAGQFQASDDPLPGSVAVTPLQFTRVYTGHLNPGETQNVVINIDPNVTVANFALYDTTRTLEITVVGASGNTIQLDPARNSEIRVTDPSTLIYLGYGFKEPTPGRWIITLHTTGATPAGGADYAINAQFNGGAVLQARTNTMLPKLNESVTINANLTASGIPVSLDSAQAQLRKPDGSAETLAMSIDSNTGVLTFRSDESGIYGIEVRVMAHTQENMQIDRAAFLTFEVQSSNEIISMNRLLTLLALVLMIGLVGWIIQRRRKKASQRQM